MGGPLLSGFEIPFSYSNTCALGMELFDTCDCGRQMPQHDMINQLPTPVSSPTPHTTKSGNQEKKTLKNYSKPLLFINYDTNLKPSTNRSDITSHLRTSYQPWKRRMQVSARQKANKSIEAHASMRLSTGNDRSGYLESSNATQDSTKVSELPSDRHLKRGERSLVQFYDQDERSELDEDFRYRTRMPSPRLYHGNSDPFSSLSLEITPLVAELIKFEHAHLHPCVYSTKNAPNQTYGNSYSADMHGPAANQAAVYGYLSRAAIVLASASPDPRFTEAALVLKGKSSVLLRAQLADGDITDKRDISRKVLALMIAELFAHNYDAAVVHSKVLIGLLKLSSRKKEFDIRFFFSAVYSEIQRSCMSLTRPCFDVGPHGWVARTFDTVGNDAFHAFASSLDIQEVPSESAVLGRELAAIFSEIRSVRIISQVYSTSVLYGTPTPLALYLPSRVVLCLGKLVSYYIDHCEDHVKNNLQNSSPRVFMKRAAALAALYWVRKASRIDSVKVSSTSTIYSAGPMILARLRESVSQFDALAIPADEYLYKDLRFWTLFIGALDEQGQADRSVSEHRWFTGQFAKAAADIRVYTWPQARSILELFPYSDSVWPHGSNWFSSIFSDASTGSTCLGGRFARDGTNLASRKNLGTEPEYADLIADHLPTFSRGAKNYTPAVLFESKLPSCNLRHDNALTDTSCGVCYKTAEQHSITDQQTSYNSAEINRRAGLFESNLPARSFIDKLTESNQQQELIADLGSTVHYNALVPSRSFARQAWDMVPESSAPPHEALSDARVQKSNLWKEGLVPLVNDSNLAGS